MNAPATLWYSLRRRLLVLLLGGFSAGWLVMLASSYIDAHHEIDEMFDAQLAQTAQALLTRRHDTQRDDGGDGDGDSDDNESDAKHAAHRYQSKVMFQIWHDNGDLLQRSANAPDRPLTDVEGYSEQHDALGHWRIFSQWDERRHHRVQVAENHQVRDELVGHIALRLLLPALFGLPLLGAWVWLATRRALEPLDAVAAQIASRQPERLHALAPASAPQEIRPLVEAINDLFGRVDKTLESERRFTADAAHELRTPLAALATQAQVALRARDADERQHAIDQLIAGSRRAARLVDQLLTLARLDPDAPRPTDTVKLDRLAEEVCAAHGGQALLKNITLELDAMPVIVIGNADMLRVLLRNLVDNALRYTPNGGQVTVAITPGRLSVSDSGPGIPAEERQRVFDRFRRLAGQETEGSGLGLSIVARIAEMHGATIGLAGGADGRGLQVEVVFPLQTTV
jgi:two-component system, OmpR family, sensor histidine kinase QseC